MQLNQGTVIFKPATDLGIYDINQLRQRRNGSIKLFSRKSSLSICTTVKSRYNGDGHPTVNRNPYNGYINPYYWVDDHPLYGNHGSWSTLAHMELFFHVSTDAPPVTFPACFEQGILLLDLSRTIRKMFASVCVYMIREHVLYTFAQKRFCMYVVYFFPESVAKGFFQKTCS